MSKFNKTNRKRTRATFNSKDAKVGTLIRRVKPHSAEFSVTRIHRLPIEAGKLIQAIDFLRSSTLRHYITPFLEGRLQLAVCINPFSSKERKRWRAFQSRFG